MSGDGDLLRVMAVFEAGSKLRCKSEILCLAAHIYHRFYTRTNDSFNCCEPFTVSAACIKLAAWFFEQPLSTDDLCLAMCSVIWGKKKFYLDKSALDRYKQSVNLTMQVILVHVNADISFKCIRRISPGELRLQLEQKERQKKMEPEKAREEAEQLLVKNSRDTISGQRWLAHYLYALRHLVEPNGMTHFRRLANIAWTYLNDYHWTPAVTQVEPNHLACGCLMFAIETIGPYLQSTRADKATLWKCINRRWNLILCDSFEDTKYVKLRANIMAYYKEYDRALQHELKTYVIDPM